MNTVARSEMQRSEVYRNSILSVLVEIGLSKKVAMYVLLLL
jgi:hypothetical protein